MQIRQSEEYVGDDWWRWSVWIDGSDEELDGIEFVEWRLHPTFPNPVRRETGREGRFRLDAEGWGVFPVIAIVQLKGGEVRRLRHELELHWPDGRPNTD